MDTIEHPLTGEKIRIAKADFTDRMTWDQANAGCNALGNGWRLPTKEELNEIYKNQHAIGGFANDSYWSSSEFGDSRAWLQGFNNGNQVNYFKRSHLYVRAVREVL